jgi:serine/threonine protein kinase/Tol biopolymer transport system component
VADAAERWETVRRVFTEALERAAGDERARFLDSACAGDPALRREVESLLASHGRAGNFLESPIVEAEVGTAVLAGGTRLGPYEVTSLLGVGGMGEIYRARDPRLDRDVAVKVLPAALARNPERLARFEQEAHAASALNHPHIVALYDVGRERGLAYIVTELLEGQTLADRIAQGPVPVRKALDYAAQAASGLAAAHERGIVHRDVKPANLFVTGDGQVKILDFGLAKLADSFVGSPARASGSPSAGALPPTTPGLAMGTVGYMSPEQVRGEAADSRSDQFSLGCVLYELLAGEAPFRRPSGAQTMAAVIEDEPVPIRERNPRVPEPVAWIVERCLAKEGVDRYAATRDLAHDLETASRRLSDLRTEGMARRGRSPSRTLARVALGVGLVALGALAAWLLRPRPEPVPVARFLTYSGRDSSPAASPDGRTVVFSSTRDGRRRLWLKQLATGSEVPLTDGDDDHPRFSPDGSVVLFSRTEGSGVSLYRVPSLGGEPRRVIADALFGDYAPAGGMICFLKHVIEPEWTTIVATASEDGSRIRELARVPGRALKPPRWSPDGRTIAVAEARFQAGQRIEIALVDATTGRSRILVPATTASPDALAWVGAETLAYSQSEVAVSVYSGNTSSIVLQDVRSARARSVFSTPFDMEVLDILGPGHLVFGANSYRIHLRELPTRSEKLERGRWLTGGSSSDRQPVYDPAGEWIVFSSNRGGNLDLWAMSRSTGAVRRITDDPADDYDPSFTRSGKLLWSTNRTGNFEVWMAESDGTAARQVTRDGVDAENPVATPDGQWILYASANPRSRGIMRIRPDGNGAAPLVPGNMQLPEVSPDGRHVAFVADLGAERPALRVANVADGTLLDFQLPLPPWTPAGDVDVGRCRWFPDGRALAFIGLGPDGVYGVYVQEFARTGRPTPRPRLVASEPNLAVESFGISPDGTSLTVAYLEQISNLMTAENVPRVGRPRRAAAE